jgi:hypothetical protein
MSTAASTTMGLEPGDSCARASHSQRDPDQRVHDGIQPRQLGGIGEHLGRQRPAVDRAISRDDVLPERLGHLAEPSVPGR